MILKCLFVTKTIIHLIIVLIIYFYELIGIICRIEIINEEWHLKVDQRGYDVILQTLPWSYGMIKLPWMLKPLIVEWI